MSRGILRLTRMKFLFALFLALLLVPALSVREESEPENPFYPFPCRADGAYLDGPYQEELCILPASSPNVTFINPSSAGLTLATSSAEDATIKVTFLLALDEQFYAYYYYTPQYGKVNGLLYAELQIGRASYCFEQVFGVGLVVVGVTVWHKDTTEWDDVLDEVIRETGYYQGMTVNGYVVEALLTFVYSEIKYQGSSMEGFEDPATNTVVVRYKGYPWDDNIVEHECSHLMNALDGVYWGDSATYACYEANCIMSYRIVYLKTWEEDGVVWEVPSGKASAACLYNDWCCKSFAEVDAGKNLFIGNDDTSLHSGDC